MSVPVDYIQRLPLEVDVPEGKKLLLASTEIREGWTNYLEIHNDNWPVSHNFVGEMEIGPAICQFGFYLGRIMTNAWNSLKDGGIFRISAPYYTSSLYTRNPKNILPITEDTFGFYSVPWCYANKEALQGKCDFDILSVVFDYEGDYQDKSEAAKSYARRHYNNVVKGIKIVLKAVKPERG